MGDTHNKTTWTRRKFLQAAGLATAAVAGVPVFNTTGRAATPPSAHTAAAATALTVGVLLPPASRSPLHGQQLVAGLRLALQQGLGASPEQLITVDYGDDSSAATQAAWLLDQHHVDVVVGILSNTVAAQLLPLFVAQRTPLVVVNYGEDFVRTMTNPYLYYSSLNYWQTHWAMGAWAVRNVGPHAAVYSSLYHSGYDALYAFRAGFEAGGGVVVNTEVIQAPQAAAAWDTAWTTTMAARPDLVYGLFAGADAVAFTGAYQQSGLAGTIPLLGSGLMVDDAGLATHGAHATGIKNGLAWTGSLTTAENSRFVQSFGQATGQQPDGFAALGYETGQLLAQALAGQAGHPSAAAALVAGLPGTTFRAPRGLVRLDPVTHATIGPLYVHEVQATGTGLANVVLAALDTTPLTAGATATLAAIPKTGWITPLLSF